ncbi:MAG TPA: hypothetical protein VG204_15025 [Terriglobia bacterium]|nr:hypothetical protein [Terriglobia bacterium]
MDYHKIVDWLLSEAGAGWVFGGLSLFALMVNWFRQRRGQRIIYREVVKASVLSVRESFRERISVQFDNKPVKNLGILVVELFNRSSQAITDIGATLEFGEDTVILVCICEATPKITGFEVATESSQNRLLLKVPYLNSIRQHGHKIKAYIVIDGSVHNVEPSGGGVGWSLHAVRIPTRRQVLKRAGLLFGLLIAGLAALNRFYNPLIERRFRIPANEFSLRVLLVASIPTILLSVGVFALFIIWVMVPEARRDAG